MKLIKILGLVVVVALPVMAVSGATAAISQAKTVKCSTNTTPCTGMTYGEGTKFVAEVVAPAQKTIKGENASQEALPNITCQISKMEGEISGNDGNQVLGVISKVVQENCTAGKLFSCTIEVLQTPYNFSDLYTEAQNGTFTVFAEAPKEQPGQRISCPIVGLNCVFKVSEINSQNNLQAGILTQTGGDPATLTANQVQLKTSTPAGGNCLNLKSAKWSAVYTVTSPKPLYQSKDQ